MAEKLPFGVPERMPFLRSDKTADWAALFHDAALLSSNSGIYDFMTRMRHGGGSALPVKLYWGLQEHKVFDHAGSFPNRPPVSQEDFMKAWEEAQADKTGTDKYKNLNGKTDPAVAALRKTLLALAHGSTEQAKEERVKDALGQTARQQFFKDGKPNMTLIDAESARVAPPKIPFDNVLTLMRMGAPIGNLTLKEIQQVSAEKVTETHTPWVGKSYTTERGKTPAEIQRDLLELSQKKSGLTQEDYNRRGYHGRSYLNEQGQPDYALIAKHVELLKKGLMAEDARRHKEASMKDKAKMPWLDELKAWQEAMEHFGVSTKNWPATEFDYQWNLKKKQREKGQPVEPDSLEEKITRVMALKGSAQNEPPALRRLGQLYSPEGRLNAELLPPLAAAANKADLTAFYPHTVFYAETALDVYDKLTKIGFDTSRVTLGHLAEVQRDINAGNDAAGQITRTMSDKPVTEPGLRKLFPADEPAPAAKTPAPAAPKPAQ